MRTLTRDEVREVRVALVTRRLDLTHSLKEMGNYDKSFILKCLEDNAAVSQVIRNGVLYIDKDV